MIIQRVLKSGKLNLFFLFYNFLFFKLDFIVFISEFLFDKLLTKIIVLSSQFCDFKFKCIYLTDVLAFFLRWNHHSSVQTDDFILSKLVFVNSLLVLKLLDLSLQFSVFLIKISIVLVHLKLTCFVINQFLNLSSKFEVFILKIKDPFMIFEIYNSIVVIDSFTGPSLSSYRRLGGMISSNHPSCKRRFRTFSPNFVNFTRASTLSSLKIIMNVSELLRDEHLAIIVKESGFQAKFSRDGRVVRFVSVRGS